MTADKYSKSIDVAETAMSEIEYMRALFLTIKKLVAEAVRGDLDVFRAEEEKEYSQIIQP